ncbi:hypothetical protein RI054_39g144810 [Pseudoscourfieldia marina]
MSDPVGGAPCHVPLNLLRKLPSYRTPPNAVPASLRRPQPPNELVHAGREYAELDTTTIGSTAPPTYSREQHRDGETPTLTEGRRRQKFAASIIEDSLDGGRGIMLPTSLGDYVNVHPHSRITGETLSTGYANSDTSLPRKVGASYARPLASSGRLGGSAAAADFAMPVVDGVQGVTRWTNETARFASRRAKLDASRAEVSRLLNDNDEAREMNEGIRHRHGWYADSVRMPTNLASARVALDRPENLRALEMRAQARLDFDTTRSDVYCTPVDGRPPRPPLPPPISPPRQRASPKEKQQAAGTSPTASTASAGGSPSKESAQNAQLMEVPSFVDYGGITVVSDAFGIVRVEQRGHYGEMLGTKHKPKLDAASRLVAPDPTKGKRGAGGFVWKKPVKPVLAT